MYLSIPKTYALHGLSLPADCIFMGLGTTFEF